MEIINVTDEIIEVNVTEEVITIQAPTGAYPLPNAVNSVFGRVGSIVATEGDYTLTQLGGVTITSPSNGQVLKYNGTTWVNDSDSGITGTGTTNTLPKFTGASTIGNSNITDSGTAITLNSDTAIGTTSLATATKLTIGGTETAVSAISRGQFINTTLVASANSDALVGLDIAPTYNLGAFTSVIPVGLRLQQGVASAEPLRINMVASPTSAGALVVRNSSNTIIYRVDVSGNMIAGLYYDSSNQNNYVGFVGNGFNVNFGGNIYSRYFPTTGNLTLQNGGTFTDAGFRLDVNGTTRFIGTASSDTAALGSELAAVTGTGTNWTLAGTNLNVGGYTHTTGSVVPLTTALAAVNGTYYQIAYTITGRTAGTITIAYGGTSTTVSATGASGPLATSTAVLTITPTTDFDGTVVLSIKSIGNSVASCTFASSALTNNLEIRAANETTNTFIGRSAGRRYTTGIGNTFLGSNSGGNNTTGNNNTFVGVNAGVNNTIGGENVFIGVNSGINNIGTLNTFIGTFTGQSNTTGLNNTFLGRSAGSNNTTGSQNVMIGNDAGRFIANGSTSNIFSNTSIFIGNVTKSLADNQANQIVIGHSTTGLGSNTTIIGTTATTITALYGDLLLGTTTPSTATILTVSGTETASSAIARGGLINTTLVASANNDVLVGLDIQPTFTNGAFTGVTNYAARLNGNIFVQGNNSTISGEANSKGFIQFGAVTFAIGTSISTTDLTFNAGITTKARIYGTTGNLVLQNGGAFTDAGFRLDVNGVTRIQGTASTDSPPLGSELLTTSNWTSTGWTGDFTTGFTHTTGNTSVLSNTLAAVIGTYYKVQITMTGRTAGSIIIGFGGDSRSITTTRSFEPVGATTGNLTITPTSDFNGTIIVSVKTIGLASPSLTLSPSTGTGQITMRATNVSNNTIIGLEAGQRLSSSGVGDDGANNTFIGYRAGRNSTTVRYNTFIGGQAGELTSTGTDNTGVGRLALNSNTTGLENTAIGGSAGGNNTTGLQNTFVGNLAGGNNTTGFNNVFFGYAAGRFITGGVTANTNATNSIFIGRDTKAAADNQNNQIVIGQGTTGLGTNTTIIGNSSTTITGLYGNIRLVSGMGTAPASATATGTTGDIVVTAGFIYVCTATNTWVRTALTTW